MTDAVQKLSWNGTGLRKTRVRGGVRVRVCSILFLFQALHIEIKRWSYPHQAKPVDKFLMHATSTNYLLCNPSSLSPRQPGIPNNTWSKKQLGSWYRVHSLSKLSKMWTPLTWRPSWHCYLFWDNTAQIVDMPWLLIDALSVLQESNIDRPRPG